MKATRAAGPPARAAGSAVRRRDLVWVDACEVDHHGGYLTIRAGSLDDAPLVIALPAREIETLPDSLRAASLDAEETYWDVVIPLVRRVHDPEANSEAVNAVVSAWVLSQDWVSATERRAAADDELLIVSHVGFVGVGVGPPFTRAPALAVFDPLQLRRLEGAFRGAVAEAIGSGPADWNEATVSATVRLLSQRPWGDLGRADPTAAEASSEMRDRRIQFLAREPLLRPDTGRRPP